MDNIPIHMRITGLMVTNEDVNSRRAATTELASSVRPASGVEGLSRESANPAEAEEIAVAKVIDPGAFGSWGFDTEAGRIRRTVAHEKARAILTELANRALPQEAKDD